jgi:hypothetical protein
MAAGEKPVQPFMRHVPLFDIHVACNPVIAAHILLDMHT